MRRGWAAFANHHGYLISLEDEQSGITIADKFMHLVFDTKVHAGIYRLFLNDREDL
jgi:hypothetical protein